jgi:hypothetical protein
MGHARPDLPPRSGCTPREVWLIFYGNVATVPDFIGDD